jgi:hypothetical protein
MSELSPSAPGKAGPPKQPVSPARNAIGLVVLAAVVVIGYFEVKAKMGYNAATSAVDKRLQDEEHGLPEQEEAEKLIGKQADDAGSEVQDGGSRFLKKTYTWKGLFTSYTLVAYYRQGLKPALDHIEAGEKFQPAPAQVAPTAGEGGPPSKAVMKPQAAKAKGGEKAKGKEKSKAATEEKKAPEPEAKAPADDKAKTPADDKAKAPADDKANTPADDKAKAD